MTEQILDHGSLCGYAPKGWGVCWPQEASGALGSLYLESEVAGGKILSEEWPA